MRVRTEKDCERCKQLPATHTASDRRQVCIYCAKIIADESGR